VTHDHILLVDDDRVALDALASLLRDEGYNVTTATDGAAALATIAHAPPAMVISDVQMPRSDGYQLVRRLRADRTTKHVPILLLSALGQPARRVIGLDLGADDFLSKPVDFGELLARVRVHLRHAHDREALERQSLVDPLTGVLNRRGIHGVLVRELARVARTPAPLSVLMVDVDRFKRINDEHGHAVGDTVLRHVARALEDTVRAADHVGRYGGDEFLVVLADADAADAALLVDRLRERGLPPLAVEGGADLLVSVSLGVATLQPDESVDELVARADAAMYRVKQRGRG
jgi:diguanylate cyclase (GGDEF)-like protein